MRRWILSRRHRLRRLRCADGLIPELHQGQLRRAEAITITLPRSTKGGPQGRHGAAGDHAPSFVGHVADQLAKPTTSCGLHGRSTPFSSGPTTAGARQPPPAHHRPLDRMDAVMLTHHPCCGGRVCPERLLVPAMKHSTPVADRRQRLRPGWTAPQPVPRCGPRAGRGGRGYPDAGIPGFGTHRRAPGAEMGICTGPAR